VGRAPLLFGSGGEYRLDRDEETRIEEPEPEGFDAAALARAGGIWLPGDPIPGAEPGPRRARFTGDPMPPDPGPPPEGEP
jgi:hypothetical protein